MEQGREMNVKDKSVCTYLCMHVCLHVHVSDWEEWKEFPVVFWLAVQMVASESSAVMMWLSKLWGREQALHKIHIPFM